MARRTDSRRPNEIAPPDLQRVAADARGGKLDEAFGHRGAIG